ncbi:MAG: C69 family dipeptidase [Bacteroides sp.]|nr:C69 family dipeptidase [Ruminococcus flavefaciens]MCM1554159.1 C69 family dipeptidase [Bacteroides sp.]
MKNFRKLLCAIGFAALCVGNGFACTNFLITKGASKDGSTMISYAADSHVLYGELYYIPAADYPEGAMMDIYEWDSGRKMGQIKQVRHTYSVVGNMNEYQLAIGETTFGGLPQLVDTTAIMDYGSLIYVTLQRAKTAREAIKVMDELVRTYGYASGGESFSICDPDEVWIMEMVGKGVGNKGAVWVAYRIPDGYISGHANQARITKIKPANGKTSITSKDLGKKYNLATVECIYAADVVDYAKSAGLYSGKFEDFSFSDTYCPLTFSGMRGCEARVWAGFMKANRAEAAQYEDYARGENASHRMPLWIKPDRKLTLNDMMSFMRDHYEGTSMDMTKDLGAGPFACPYRWRPMDFEVDGKKYIHERATSTQQTGFSFVAQCRGWLPRQIGGILWFGVDDTYSTCYAPMYCGITEIPLCFRVGNGDMVTYSPTSAFWLFNLVTNFAYGRYSDMIVDIQMVQSYLENAFQQEVAENDAKMKDETDNAKLVAFANQFSNAKAEQMFNSWKKLSEYLLVKYIDGNVKKTNANGNFTTTPYGHMEMPEWPPYPEFWYRKIVEDCGDNIKEVEVK